MVDRRKYQTVEQAIEYFWSMVDKTGDCWEWTGGSKGNGYGSYTLPAIMGRKTVGAHRFAYEVTTGEKIDEKLVVMHSCDNRLCVNPGHLSVGTYSDNLKDCVIKGRASNPQTKKTHCPKGHEYSPTNTMTYTHPYGYIYRRCRECANGHKRLKRAASAIRQAASGEGET